jgi:hypothetical protein
VAEAVNAGLTMLTWGIGRRIRQDILEEKRAAYDAEILQTLSAKLTLEFGRGFRTEIYPQWCILHKRFQMPKSSPYCGDN